MTIPVAADPARTTAPATRPVPFAVPLFRRSFRAFFLICGLWAVAAMLVWSAALHGAALSEGLLSSQRWHAHEMIAGFVGAAMCGFLLTAVPNWTERPGYAGWPVIGLAALLLAARLALLPGVPLPSSVAAGVALLPIPALLLTVLPAVLAARTPRLFGPPALILVFWVGDLLMLGEAAGWFAGTWAAGQMLALNVVLALVGLIGGRILPPLRPARTRPSRPRWVFCARSFRNSADIVPLRPTCSSLMSPSAMVTTRTRWKLMCLWKRAMCSWSRLSRSSASASTTWKRPTCASASNCWKRGRAAIAPAMA